MRKSILNFTILLMSMFLITGCGSSESASFEEADQISSEIVVDDSAMTLDESAEIALPDSTVSEQTVEDSSVQTYTGVLVSPYEELIDLSDRMASGYMRIDDLEEMCDYINEQVSVGNLKMTFEYTPGAELLDPTQIAWASSKMSISYIILPDNPNAMELTVFLYPGDEIANAYLTGDESALNADEKQVLQIATEVVENAKATAKSELELERILHDWVCQQITYYDEPDNRQPGDPENPTRFLTAIGGVLDGKANCQGYSDTFYMLATMAGFKVNRLSAYTETDTHMFNLIYVNKGWYILDTTFDDREFADGREETVYMSFNAGVDRRGEMYWTEELQYLPIKETSDENYYYLMSSDFTGQNYQIWYDSIDEAATGVVNELKENGQTYQKVFVPDANDKDGSIFFDKMYAYLRDSGLSYGYSGSTCINGPDALYEIRFE